MQYRVTLDAVLLGIHYRYIFVCRQDIWSVRSNQMLLYKIHAYMKHHHLTNVFSNEWDMWWFRLFKNSHPIIHLCPILESKIGSSVYSYRRVICNVMFYWIAYSEYSNIQLYWLSCRKKPWQWASETRFIWCFPVWNTIVTGAHIVCEFYIIRGRFITMTSHERHVV